MTLDKLTIRALSLGHGNNISDLEQGDKVADLKEMSQRRDEFRVTRVGKRYLVSGAGNLGDMRSKSLG